MTMQVQLNIFCRGNIFFYNLVTAGEFCCRGSHHKHKLSSSKRGRMLKPNKFKMLKPIKLLDFDDGQVFLPHDDCSTSDEDY